MSVKAEDIDEATQALFGPGTDSTNRFDVLCSFLSGKSDDIFWPVFHCGWLSCDDTWDHKDRLLQMIRERGAARPHLGHDDKVFYDRLPDSIRAYRGCSRSRVDGISWTTDRKVAEAFARGKTLAATSAPRNREFLRALLKVDVDTSNMLARSRNERISCPTIRTDTTIKTSHRDRLIW